MNPLAAGLRYSVTYPESSWPKLSLLLTHICTHTPPYSPRKHLSWPPFLQFLQCNSWTPGLFGANPSGWFSLRGTDSPVLGCSPCTLTGWAAHLLVITYQYKHPCCLQWLPPWTHRPWPMAHHHFIPLYPLSPLFSHVFCSSNYPDIHLSCLWFLPYTSHKKTLCHLLQPMKCPAHPGSCTSVCDETQRVKQLSVPQPPGQKQSGTPWGGVREELWVLGGLSRPLWSLWNPSWGWWCYQGSVTCLFSSMLLSLCGSSELFLLMQKLRLLPLPPTLIYTCSFLMVVSLSSNTRNNLTVLWRTGWDTKIQMLRNLCVGVFPWLSKQNRTLRMWTFFLSKKSNTLPWPMHVEI